MAKKPVKKAKQSVKESNSKRVPLLVKIISILGYVFSIMTIIMGVLFLAVFPSVQPIINEAIKNQAIASGQVLTTFSGISSTGVIIGGIFLIIFGIIGLLISRGLWKGRHWARIVVIVISLMGAVSALFSLEIVRLIVDLAIGLYFLLSKDVKKAFA